jgi:hypothetical protein
LELNWPRRQGAQAFDQLGAKGITRMLAGDEE